ncbi:MAG TPA: DUF4340 domain-containing protein [Stellaceae bacterium]|jgi:hypothetical protein|nr:DUF4340 domain-containing protein [Stellaceae bacterium]
MQTRSFLLLVAATIALVAGAAASVMTGNREISPPEQARLAFPDLAANLGNLAWMRLSHGSTKIDFTLVGGSWVVVEKGNYPAAPDKARRLLLGLADLTLVEAKTQRPELFGRLGLDNAGSGDATLVTLQDRLGKNVAEILIGKSRHDRLGTGDDGVYVRKPDEKRTWLARGSLDLPTDVVGWLDRRIIDLPPARIASIALTGDDGVALTLRRDSTDAHFAVTDMPADSKIRDEALLAAPAGVLAGLDLDDVQPAADLPLPATGVSTAVFTTFHGLTVTLRLFAHDNADWVALDASGNGGAAADAKTLEARVTHWVYAIPAERAKLLRTKLADLVEPAKGS